MSPHAVAYGRAGLAEAFTELSQRGIDTPGLACDVVTEVGDPSRPLLRGDQVVERRDTVGLSRRDGEGPRDVVDGSVADPPDGGLDGVEGGQEQMPALLGVVEPAERDVVIGARAFGGPGIYGVRDAENRMDSFRFSRCRFVGGCCVVDGVLSSRNAVPGAPLLP